MFELFLMIRVTYHLAFVLEWGFARMDQKCNSRYVSYTFASELFRRDAPELCKSMKLMNKKGRKLKPTKELRNVFDANIKVPPPSPPSSPSPPPPRPHASETTFKPMPQLHPANQVIMVFIPHPVHPVRAPPAYPPPPQQYQQWHLPHAHDQMPPLLPQYIQPPAQPHIVSYQGGANCQISPPIMHQPHHGGVPVIHQPVHQPKTQGPKAEPKITNSESFGEVATHLKADYHKKAEAAIAMMNLAFSHHQGQEVMTE